MSSKTVTVGSASGLHARPATLLSQAAAEAGVPVKIGRKGGEMVDAASILLLMSLGAGAGEELVLEVDGDDALLEQLADIVETDHDSKA